MNDQHLLEHYETIPLEGDAVVVRHPGLLAVLAGDPSDAAAFLNEVLDRPRSGLEVIALLQRPEALDVAAVVDTPMGLQMVLTGATHALIDEGDPSEPSIEVRTPAGGTVTDLDAGSGTVWIGTSQVRNVLRHSVFNLEAGVVPGGGALLRPIARTLSPEGDGTLTPSAPDADEPPVEVAFESIELNLASPPVRPALPVLGSLPNTREQSDAAEAQVVPDTQVPAASDESPAGELVRGIRCSRDHFNNPNAAYCQVCGISMIHLTHRLIEGVRPTLGFIVFDDGATFALDRPYRMGRQPNPGDGIDVITVLDNEHSLSRHHADLTFDGWEVILTDNGSTNGTYLWDDSRQRWDRLDPGRATTLPTGSHVALGRRTFTYESATRP